MQTQQPLTLPPYDEPEPDGTIVLGSEDDYATRHPRARDVTCVIEVADSSLRRDRTTKLAIYASSGIRRYFIFNLVARQVEEYAGPLKAKRRYRLKQILKVRDFIAFPAGGGRFLRVAVAALLP